jgi:geranylgeranyl pyrophosphate synthase
MHSGTKRIIKAKLTAQQVRELLCKHGKKAFEIAQKTILKENIENRKVREALDYFMQEVWHDLEYPGFMTLACKAVKGDPDKTLQLGASLVLIRGAMDIHDDIIDQQAIKASKPTLFGKYGQDLSILVGDVLFYEGLMCLNEAISQLKEEEKQTIANIVKKALFEVGTGVASEVDLRGNFNLPPDDCMKIVTQKSACTEMHARIGAIVGGGDKAAVDALGKFGRILGVLTMIRDEFIDIYEHDELQNRKEKECLPLPLLFAFQDKAIKNRILPILEKKRLSDKDSQTIVDIISRSERVNNLKRHMEELRKTAILNLKSVIEEDSVQLLASLLDPICEDI